jgi:hypothetical protein
MYEEVPFGNTLIKINNEIIGKVTAFNKQSSTSEEDITGSEDVIENNDDILDQEFSSIAIGMTANIEGIVIEDFHSGRDDGQSILAEYAYKGEQVTLIHTRNSGYSITLTGFFTSYEESGDSSGVYKFKGAFRVMLGLGIEIPKYKRTVFDLNIVLALSYYKLVSTYGGYCVEVRRSSDNATKNFGFISGYIDKAAILAFCGGGSGYAKTIYNQFSGGNNAIELTNSKQPRIVNSGVFEDNGFASIPASLTYMPLSSYSDIELSDNFAVYSNFYLNVNNINSRVVFKSFSGGISYTVSPIATQTLQDYINNGSYQVVNHSGLTIGNHKNYLSYKSSDNPDLISILDDVEKTSEVNGSVTIDNGIVNIFGGNGYETLNGNIKTIIIINSINVTYDMLKIY